MKLTREEQLVLMADVAKAVGGTLSEGHTKHRTGETWDDFEWLGCPGVVMPSGVVIHPIHISGHEAELETALGLDLLWRTTYVTLENNRVSWSERFADHGGDKQAARRMAGVKAVAIIGASS